MLNGTKNITKLIDTILPTKDYSLIIPYIAIVVHPYKALL
jgi:hypothetical protein